MFTIPNPPRRRGRPPTGVAQSPAERMRRYRARLLTRGARSAARSRGDPNLVAVRFRKDSLLSPSEREVIRRIVAQLHRLAEIPHRLAIFGSRAKGGSQPHSDIDLAVYMSRPSPQLQTRILSIVQGAQAPYEQDGYAIIVRPILLSVEPSGAFYDSIRDHLETVWTKPR